MVFDILMFIIAAYGAGLSTYIFVMNKPQYDLKYSMHLFAVPSERKDVKFVPGEFVSITVINTGRIPIYVGKHGFVDENEKFLIVNSVDPASVRKNNAVQPKFKGNEISGFASTNESVPLIFDDREIKPHATSIAFFHAESLLSAVRESGAKRVSMYVECGSNKKIKTIDESELSKLERVGKIGK
jgi:hypothetical protein